MKRLFSAGSFALLIAVAVLSSCKSKAKQGETCGSTSDCAESLECLVADRKFTSVTTEQADKACAASSECKQGGKCSAKKDGVLGMSCH